MDLLVSRAIGLLPRRHGPIAANASYSSFFGRSPRRASVCIDCQWRAFSQQQQKTRSTRQTPRGQLLRVQNTYRRSFGRTSRSRASEQHPEAGKAWLRPEPAAPVRVAPAEDLPSHKEGQKWTYTKQMNQSMDRLLARLSIAGHEINKYTGTDYSGIEALRQEIKEQEGLVKTRHDEVRMAKTRFDEAQTLQMASNKEVVALLERKNSWATTDLERYMSLIRSEHTNEQNVSITREELLNAERGLEEARSRLERRERAQYHEEQIWSDTIRRNSTWVTFGLMGFNVVLLLANIGFVEPWRRKRMVREIKAGIDEKGQAAGLSSSVESNTTLGEGETSQSVESDDALEQMKAAETEEVMALTGLADDFVSGTITVAPSQGKTEEVLEAVSEDNPVQSSKSLFNITASSIPGLSLVAGTIQQLRDSVADLFSARTISTRKIDLTAMVLEGTAVSTAIATGLVILLLRPGSS